MNAVLMLGLLFACGEEAPKKEVAKAEVKEAAPAATPAPAAARTGEQVFQQVCVTCHQANGQGMAGVYPPLAGSDWMAKSNETLIKIVLHGLMGEIEVNGTKYNQVMDQYILLIALWFFD